MPQFRSALKWDHFFPCLRTPKSENPIRDSSLSMSIISSEPSGLLIYTKNAKLHDDIKRTAMRSFRKSREPYLTF